MKAGSYFVVLHVMLRVIVIVLVLVVVLATARKPGIRDWFHLLPSARQRQEWGDALAASPQVRPANSRSRRLVWIIVALSVVAAATIIVVLRLVGAIHVS